MKKVTKRRSRKKGFDVLKFVWKVKKEMSEKLYAMTYEEMKAYLDSTPTIFEIRRKSKKAT